MALPRSQVGLREPQRLASPEPAPVCVNRGGFVDVEENAPDRLEVGSSAGIEAHTAMPAAEERRAQVFLEHAHAVGDGSRCDGELVRGPNEALMTGCRFEMAQAVEGRERFHGIGNPWPCRVERTNISFA